MLVTKDRVVLVTEDGTEGTKASLIQLPFQFAASSYMTSQIEWKKMEVTWPQNQLPKL